MLDDARYHVLEFFVQLGQILDATLDNLLGPLVDLLALILNLIRADNVVHGLLGDRLHVLRVELVLIFKIGHVPYSFSIINLNYKSSHIEPPLIQIEINGVLGFWGIMGITIFLGCDILGGPHIGKRDCTFHFVPYYFPGHLLRVIKSSNFTSCWLKIRCGEKMWILCPEKI